MKPYPAYKDSGIEWLGEIPEHWEKIKLRYIADVFGGSTPSSSNKDYWNGDIPWVTTDDLGKLKGKIIRKTRRTISKTGLASISKILTPNGSIIISNRAPIGHLGILGIDACTNQGCKSIVLSNVVNKFIYYYLQSTKDKINSLGKGTTFKELSTNDLKGYQFPLPSKPEQSQIAAFLDHKTNQIDDLIAKKEKLIELL